MPKSRKGRRYFEAKKKIDRASTGAPTTPGVSAAPMAAKTPAPATKGKSIAERYPYVGHELKRITVLTAVIIVILVILALVLP